MASAPVRLLDQSEPDLGSDSLSSSNVENYGSLKDDLGMGNHGGLTIRGREDGENGGDVRHMLDVAAVQQRKHYRLLGAGFLLTAFNLILLLMIITIVGVVLYKEGIRVDQDCIETIRFPITPGFHPLDGVTISEFSIISRLVTSSTSLQLLGGSSGIKLYNHVALREPEKESIKRYEQGWKTGVKREAFVVLTTKEHEVFELIVNFEDETIFLSANVTGKQPAITPTEFEMVTPTIINDPTAQQVFSDRGIQLVNVLCISYSVGYYGVPQEEGKRLTRATCYDRSQSWNYWGRPIEGLVFDIDLITNKIVKMTNLKPDANSDSVPSPVGNDFDQTSIHPIRTPPNQIIPIQRKGPTYAVKGNQVDWQGWSFHVRADPRVGMILSIVTYTDSSSTPRSVLYEASLSEMFVPYMEDTEGWYSKTFFDIGEYGFGIWASPLIIGDSVPSNAYCWDANFADSGPGTGGTIKTFKIPNAICVFERYYDWNQWLHTEVNSIPKHYQSRAKHSLVLRTSATVGNYDYLMDIEFNLDGSISFDVGATGVDSVKGLFPSGGEGEVGAAPYGTRLSESVAAIYHDHFFSFRLDLDVDGTENSFVATRLEKQEFNNIPRKSAWKAKDYECKKESEAKMKISFDNPAVWRVVNPSKQTTLGNTISYGLKPKANSLSILSKDDYPQIRAGFTDYHLWVTPYNRTELYAAGSYPNQNPEADGLPKWTSADRKIDNTDIVAWYTLGFHHVPKQEDWPVMPTTWMGFQLVPINFFERNPSVDLPVQHIVECQKDAL